MYKYPTIGLTHLHKDLYRILDRDQSIVEYLKSKIKICQLVKISFGLYL